MSIAASGFNLTASPRIHAGPRLGIGLAYQAPMRAFIEENGSLIDYLEVVPDILWTDLGRGKNPRYIDEESGVAFLRQMRSEMPVIPHAIGLSIGSAHHFNRDHVAQVAGWHQWLQFPWHSDHLSYNLTESAAGADSPDNNVGVTLPLPRDFDTIELLAPRIAEIRSAVPVPFLLENNVYYFEMPEQEMNEAGFLNLLCESSGCELLLDLHNLHVNCRNLNQAPYDFLSRLDLDRVIEIHVAGGMELDGFYLDAHSGPPPAEVLDLLRWTLPQCRNIRGVTFELFGSWYADVGAERLTRQLDELKDLWAGLVPPPERISK
jgi:uncharacterized protein (UPF0276 family)